MIRNLIDKKNSSLAVCGLGVLSLVPGAYASTQASTVTHLPDPTMAASSLLRPANDSAMARSLTAQLQAVREANALEINNARKLLLADGCSGTCNADGSGSYTQSPGCTYTQTCGGKKA